MKVELDENNLSGTKVEGWIRLRSLYVVPAHMLHAVEHFQLHPRSGGNEDRGVEGEMRQCDVHLIRRGTDFRHIEWTHKGCQWGKIDSPLGLWVHSGSIPTVLGQRLMNP